MAEAAHDPYAAPACIEPRTPTRPERIVRIAVGLYVAWYLSGIPALVLRYGGGDLPVDPGQRGIEVATTLVTYSLAALLTLFVSRGLLLRSRLARGWLVLTTVLPVFLLAWTLWNEREWTAALDIAAASARIAAAALMFWPGVPQWFRHGGGDVAGAPVRNAG